MANSTLLMKPTLANATTFLVRASRSSTLPTPTSTSRSDRHEGLDKEEVAGTVIGLCFGLAALSVCVCILLHQRKSRRRKQGDREKRRYSLVDGHHPPSLLIRLGQDDDLPPIPELEGDSPSSSEGSQAANIVLRTINPWQLEFGPNPYMFPYLASAQEYSVLMQEASGPLPLADTNTIDTGPSYGTADSTRLANPYATAQYEPLHGQDLEEDQLPFTRTPDEDSVSPPHFGDPTTDLSVLGALAADVQSSSDLQERVHHPVEIAETVFTKGVGTSPILETLDPCQQEDTSSTTNGSPSSASSISHTVTTPATSPASSISEKPKQSHECSYCSLTFRTAGQMNSHINRKHSKRYRCSVETCTKSFNLNADLKRHQKSVHRETFKDSRWKCPNPKCDKPEKLYTRKDNFDRHVNRCRAATESD